MISGHVWPMRRTSRAQSISSVPEKHTAVREFPADKDSPAFVCRFLEYQVWLTFGLYEVTGKVVTFRNRRIW
jgi:hypothetical protein